MSAPLQVPGTDFRFNRRASESWGYLAEIIERLPPRECAGCPNGGPLTIPSLGPQEDARAVAGVVEDEGGSCTLEVGRCHFQPIEIEVVEVQRAVRPEAQQPEGDL